jgi:hypothetical protein
VGGIASSVMSTPSARRRIRHAPRAGAFSCANCDFAIAGRPVFHVGLAFCCTGCVADGPCTCSYDEPSMTRLAERTGREVVVAEPEVALVRT